jgi:hypothetical protein
MKTAMREGETIGKRNKKQARRKQGCSRCPDLIGHIARVYRSLDNPDSPFG